MTYEWTREEKREAWEAVKQADPAVEQALGAIRAAFGGVGVEFIAAGGRVWGRDWEEPLDHPGPGTYGRWLPPRLPAYDGKTRPPCIPDLRNFDRDWSIEVALQKPPRDPFRRYVEDRWRAEFRARTRVPSRP